jgi:hypothetical protein
VEQMVEGIRDRRGEVVESGIGVVEVRLTGEDLYSGVLRDGGLVRAER